MFFPYFHKISVDDLYDFLTNIESSELPVLRRRFYQFSSYSWRVIPRSPLISGKLTFATFQDFYQFVKFAYIVYPNICFTLLFQNNEKNSTISRRPLESH